MICQMQYVTFVLSNVFVVFFFLQVLRYTLKYYQKMVFFGQNVHINYKSNLVAVLYNRYTFEHLCVLPVWLSVCNHDNHGDRSNYNYIITPINLLFVQ